ncbi:MAG: hypothetical protein H0W72_02280 [Planctomycetes bacterium]|nr:hypothetical protein [Planctomycetota bacterium]
MTEPLQASDIANLLGAARRAVGTLPAADLIAVAGSIARVEKLLEDRAKAEQAPPAPAPEG